MLYENQISRSSYIYKFLTNREIQQLLVLEQYLCLMP